MDGFQALNFIPTLIQMRSKITALVTSRSTYPLRFDRTRTINSPVHHTHTRAGTTLIFTRVFQTGTILVSVSPICHATRVHILPDESQCCCTRSARPQDAFSSVFRVRFRERFTVSFGCLCPDKHNTEAPISVKSKNVRFDGRSTGSPR